MGVCLYGIGNGRFQNRRGFGGTLLVCRFYGNFQNPVWEAEREIGFDQNHVGVRGLVCPVLFDGVFVRNTDYRLGGLRTLRRFGGYYVAGHNQHFVTKMPERGHGYVCVFSFSR